MQTIRLETLGNGRSVLALVDSQPTAADLSGMNLPPLIQQLRTRNGGLVAVVATSGIACLGLIWAYHRYPEDWTLVVLKDWQGLLGGFLAILAAGLAGTFALGQMRQTERLEQARLRRLARAERAMTPLIMSRICDYAHDSLGGLAHIWMLIAAGQQDLAAAVETPALAQGDLDAIKAMVLAAEDTEAPAYVSLLAELQIHNARWRGLPREISAGEGDAFWIEQLVVDAAEIYARAANLIGATRSRTAGEDLRATTRRGALRILSPQIEMPEAVKLADAFDLSQPLPEPRAFGVDVTT